MHWNSKAKACLAESPEWGADDRVFVGSHFAFVFPPEMEDSNSCSNIDSLIEQIQIIPFEDQRQIDLGVTELSPLKIPPLRISSLASDRMLYRQGSDTIRLLIVAPFCKDRSLVVELNANGKGFSQKDVRLDSLGLGEQTINSQRLKDRDFDMRTVRSIEALEFPLMLEMSVIETIGWDGFDNRVPLRIMFKNPNRAANYHVVGDQIKLCIELTKGYQFGDFLNVCLPASLSRLSGGGQVKQFAVDLEGFRKIEIPVLVTGESLDSFGEQGPHHFTVCLRNMYDEDRVARIGWIRFESSKAN